MTSQIPGNPYQSERTETSVNVGGSERNASLIGGALLLGIAFIRRGWTGLGVGALGAALIYRSTTGISHLYKLFGINRAVHDPSASISVPHQQGKHVSASITINRPIREVYDFWRDFNNLPQFMTYLSSVKVQDETHSHWSIKGPAGKTIEWDAEIINSEQDSVIAWRTLDDPFVDHAGSVRFNPASGNQGTEVRVELEYLPVGGAAGVALAGLLGFSPQQAVMHSLRQLKQLLEVGAVSTIKGQTSARADTEA